MLQTGLAPPANQQPISVKLASTNAFSAVLAAGSFSAVLALGQDVKDKLTAALKATVEDATVIKNLANLKLKPAWQDQDAFGKFASTVYKQNGELLANAGLIAK